MTQRLLLFVIWIVASTSQSYAALFKYTSNCEDFLNGSVPSLGCGIPGLRNGSLGLGVGGEILGYLDIEEQLLTNTLGTLSLSEDNAHLWSMSLSFGYFNYIDDDFLPTQYSFGTVTSFDILRNGNALEMTSVVGSTSSEGIRNGRPVNWGGFLYLGDEGIYHDASGLTLASGKTWQRVQVSAPQSAISMTLFSLILIIFLRCRTRGEAEAI